MADNSTSTGDRGRDRGRLRVEVEGWRFRVLTPEISTRWLPDTPSNRHLTVVWLRLRVDDRGKPLYACKT